MRSLASSSLGNQALHGLLVNSAGLRRFAVVATEYRQGFKTCYRDPDPQGQVHEHLFDTATENNEFASAIGLMGVLDVRKYWYSYTMAEWFRYHNNREE